MAARMAGKLELGEAEKARTNASDGSLTRYQPSNQALRKLPPDWQEQNQSIELIDGDVSVSRNNPLKEANLARGVNADGTPYKVYTAQPVQAVEKPGDINKRLTEGAYQSSVKLNVQVTNVPEVSTGVKPDQALEYVGQVMQAGANAVRPVEEHLSKPNAVNNDLWNLPRNTGKFLEHLAQCPEQLNNDVAAVAGPVLDTIDKPMMQEQRASMAGMMLPLFFFEGGNRPIDKNVVQQMNLEHMTEEELKALGIERKAVKIADNPSTEKTQKPAEITSEALDNPEGLAKLAKKFGINMPPKNTYVFVGEKDALSAEAAAKRLGLTKEQLEKLDEAALVGKNLERVPDYRDVFFNAYPGLIPIADRIWVHHGLPKWLLKGEYQGLFTAKEINDVRYLRGIYEGVNKKLHLEVIHGEWREFAKQFPNATRRQVFAKMRELDKSYGHLFAPTKGE